MVPRSLLSGLALAAFAAPASAIAAPPAASEVAVLGLFRAADPAAHAGALDALGSAASGCAIRRQGKVAGTRGPLALPEPNRFLLLRCQSSLLEDPAGLAAIEGLGGELVLLEGSALWSGDEPDASVAERAYVIKLSRFNEEAPGAREADLAAIGRDVSQRPHAYVNEAVISVARSRGADGTDDVTVLYYRRPSDGKAFRQQNPDLMKRIGAFNETHVADFVYVNGVAER
ncbi:MAG: hypothetical protein ACR2P8_04845 [Myxococcota bacterium]